MKTASAANACDSAYCQIADLSQRPPTLGQCIFRLKTKNLITAVWFGCIVLPVRTRMPAYVLQLFTILSSGPGLYLVISHFDLKPYRDWIV